MNKLIFSIFFFFFLVLNTFETILSEDFIFFCIVFEYLSQLIELIFTLVSIVLPH